MNVTDPIWHWAGTFPDRVAVHCDGQQLTFGTFCRHVDSAAWNLAQAGISKGQRVGVASSNPLMHLTAILALARLGATSAAVSLAATPTDRAEMARRFGLTAFVRNHAEWTIDGIPATAHLLTEGLVDPYWSGRHTAPDDVDDQPWRIGLSSGTTGLPKGVVWTHAQAARYVDLTQKAVASGPSERLLMHMDAMMLFALHHLVRQLYAGGALVIPKAIDAAEFFKCVRRDRVTQVITSTATAWNLLQYAKRNEAAVHDATASLRSFSVGGSAISAAVQSELRDRFCSELYINYGSSEGGLLARADPESLRRHPRSAGYLMPWVEGEAVDDAGTALPPGSSGLLRFRTLGLASRYEGDPEASAKVFRDGWYYPGDTGSVDARGLLRLGARADDIINFGGIKVDPLVVEAVLNEDPAVRESVVVAAVADNGAAVLVGVVTARAPVDVQALRTRCRDRLGPELCPATIITIEQLPRNAEGKVLRREVARLVQLRAAKPGKANGPG